MSGCGWSPAETTAVVPWRSCQHEGSLTPTQHLPACLGAVLGRCQGSATPHLKGYPNWMLMAVISPLSHFTVAPVSPLKEPQEPKAKMAKSYRRGQWVWGVEALGRPLSSLGGGLYPPVLSNGRAATAQLLALGASFQHWDSAGTGI